MNISCPLCATNIEVSKFLVGQKGRCPRCSSKFLIPESEDAVAEILEKGEIPANDPEPEPKPAPAKPAEKKAESAPPKVAPKPAAGRAVLPAAGAAPMRAPARPVVVKQSSGAFGFLFAIVLAALVGVVVYVMMEREKTRKANAAAAAKPKEPKVIKVIQQPRQRDPVTPIEEPEPEPEEGIPVFARVIQPILEAKCVSCHGEEKKKGRLAMHTFEALAAGSGNGSVVEADADDETRIELLFRAELPESDDEHMPPQGKPQLTPEELAILKWWVKEGAYEDTEHTEAPDEIKESIKGLAKL